MKKFLSLLICIAVLFCLMPHALASSPKIVDDADLLSSDEEQLLEEKAQQLVDRYQMDVVIVTVWSLDGKSAQAYADDYFDYNGYGIGSDYSGVLFLLSMEYRDWAISTCGDTIYALTDYGIETLFESCKTYLAYDEYYLAFDRYLDELPLYFDAYENGSPIDGFHDSDDDDYIIYDPDDSGGTVYYDPQPSLSDLFRIIVVAVIVGLIAAAITLAIMRSSMNTFRQQSNATSYLPSGAYNLHHQRDIFLYSQVSKTRRDTDSGSSHRSSGGSSTHRSSSGRSHGGRSGKF